MHDGDSAAVTANGLGRCRCASVWCLVQRAFDLPKANVSCLTTTLLRDPFERLASEFHFGLNFKLQAEWSTPGDLSCFGGITHAHMIVPPPSPSLSSATVVHSMQQNQCRACLPLCRRLAMILLCCALDLITYCCTCTTARNMSSSHCDHSGVAEVALGHATHLAHSHPHVHCDHSGVAEAILGPKRLLGR